MAYNKMEEFKKIDELLNEVRKACNYAQIPFIWVAAVADSSDDTTYMVAVDENESVDNGKKQKKYMCNTLTPGCMDIHLKDDKIRDIIKVLNGFQVTARNDPLAIDPEEFSISSMLSYSRGIYEDSEGGFVMPINEVPEEKKPGKDMPVTSQKGNHIIALQQISFDSLPRIEEDYEDTPDVVEYGI